MTKSPDNGQASGQAFRDSCEFCGAPNQVGEDNRAVYDEGGRQLFACDDPSLACEQIEAHRAIEDGLRERVAQLEAAHAKAIAQRDWMVEVLIDRWHDMGNAGAERGLPEWLSFTEDQYHRWVADPMDFPDVAEGYR